MTDHLYHTFLYNIIFDIGLSPEEFAVYMQLKRAADGGQEAVDFTAQQICEAAGVSYDQWPSILWSLERFREELDGLPLVQTDFDRLVITDLSNVNFRYVRRQEA